MAGRNGKLATAFAVSRIGRHGACCTACADRRKRNLRSRRPAQWPAVGTSARAIGGSLGGIVSLLFSLGLQSAGFFADRHNTFAAMAGMGAGSAAFIVLIPLFVIIGLFIGSAVVHLCLMIVGGANQSFETTFRVLAFSQGSAGPLQMIPVCGGLISGVWGLVCSCIGLARAHDTDTGRAVLAVFLPLIVCCGGILLVGLMLGGLGAWSASHH